MIIFVQLFYVPFNIKIVFILELLTNFIAQLNKIALSTVFMKQKWMEN